MSKGNYLSLMDYPPGDLSEVYNRQVYGARIRFRSYMELGIDMNSDVMLTPAMMRQYATRTLIGSSCTFENGTACPDRLQINEDQWRHNRFLYRIGNNTDMRTQSVCVDNPD